MNINKKIINSLKPISDRKIPISFMRNNKNSNTYITFFEYYAMENEYDDNEASTREHYIQIDIFSKYGYSELVDEVIELMKKNGFYLRELEQDLYEEDTKLYHKPIRFMYVENLGGK